MSKYGHDVDIARASDFATRAIHEGDSFSFREVLSLGSAEIGSYMLTTPDTLKYPHLFFEAEGTFGFTADLYEAVDGSGAIAQTVYNRNRNSETAAAMILHKGCSAAITSEARIVSDVVGSATVAGKLTGGEWVLGRNVKYVLKLTSSAASNKVAVRFAWYERADV